VYLNLGIRIRDQVRFPTACDIKAVLAELAEEGGVHWSLLFDVSKAHRRIPVLEEEWGRQACQIRGMAAATAGIKRAQTAFRPGVGHPRRATPLRRSDFSPRELREFVYANCVGTFGVTSAGYWWGRAGGAIMRLAHYFLGYADAVRSLLYSDDGKITGRT
jgi:hypothetical protein